MQCILTKEEIIKQIKEKAYISRLRFVKEVANILAKADNEEISVYTLVPFELQDYLTNLFGVHLQYDRDKAKNSFRNMDLETTSHDKSLVNSVISCQIVNKEGTILGESEFTFNRSNLTPYDFVSGFRTVVEWCALNLCYSEDEILAKQKRNDLAMRLLPQYIAQTVDKYEAILKAFEIADEFLNSDYCKLPK